MTQKTIALDSDTWNLAHELHGDFADHPRKVPLRATVRAGLEELREELDNE